MEHIALRTHLENSQLGNDVLLHDIDSLVIEQAETIEYESDLNSLGMETMWRGGVRVVGECTQL